MRLIVYLGKMLKIKVGVDLCRADVGMAEQFLNAAQILAGLEQVGSEAVAEQVRVYPLRDAGVPGPVFDPALDRPWADAPAADADEQGGLVLVSEFGPNLLPVL